MAFAHAMLFLTWTPFVFKAINYPPYSCQHTGLLIITPFTKLMTDYKPNFKLSSNQKSTLAEELKAPSHNFNSSNASLSTTMNAV